MTRSSFAALLVATALAGCAGPGPEPERLSALRTEIAQVRADPAVNRLAPVPLHEAGQALAMAEAAAQRGDGAAFDHWAFITRARLETAQARAAAEAARDSRERLAQQLAVEGAAQPQPRPGRVLTFSDVLFEVGEAQLKPGAFNRLQPLATHLRQNPNEMVVIEGHTDSVGGSDLNMDLSRRRAEAVRDFLVGAGIEPQRIEARGMGEAYPIATNDTVAGRQQNRRVEVLISEAPG